MNPSRYTALSRAAAVLALPQTWTALAVMLVAALSLWGWWLEPAHWLRWVALAVFLPALWGFVELMQSGTLRAERWVFSMVGVGIVLAWLTLPIALADRVGEGLILAAVVLAIGRKLYSVATHHRPTTHEGSGVHAPSRN